MFTAPVRPQPQASTCFPEDSLLRLPISAMQSIVIRKAQAILADTRFMASRMRGLEAHARRRYPEHAEWMIGAMSVALPMPAMPPSLRLPDSMAMRALIEQGRAIGHEFDEALLEWQLAEAVKSIGNFKSETGSYELPGLRDFPGRMAFKQTRGYCTAYCMEYINLLMDGWSPAEIIRSLPTPLALERAREIHGIWRPYEEFAPHAKDKTMVLQHMRRASMGAMVRDAFLHDPQRTWSVRDEDIAHLSMSPLGHQVFDEDIRLSLGAFLSLWRRLGSRPPSATSPSLSADAKGKPKPEAGELFLPRSPDFDLEDLMARVERYPEFAREAKRWCARLDEHLDVHRAHCGSYGSIAVGLYAGTGANGHEIVIDLNPVQPGIFDPNYGFLPLPPVRGLRSPQFYWLMALFHLKHKVTRMILCSFPRAKPTPVRFHLGKK